MIKQLLSGESIVNFNAVKRNVKNDAPFMASKGFLDNLFKQKNQS